MSALDGLTGGLSWSFWVSEIANAPDGQELTVQIATKLNRSHPVHSKTASCRIAAGPR